MASGAKLTIVSRGELPHAEVRKQGQGWSGVSQESYFLQKQNSNFNNTAFLKLGSLETTKGDAPRLGARGLDHHFIKNSQ